MLLPGKEVQVTPESLAEWEAVDLFVQRVRLVRPDFSLDEHTAPVVAEIVRRLDGLPLAIELAAARARVLTPQGILERLDDRLKLLVGGAENVPARQRTLRGAIDWSYDLLDDAEARLFRRLSVFVGGCSLSAAERMAEDDDLSGAPAGRDALDLIASLVDKSLLKEESGPGGENRLLMLETLREYGLERLRAAGEEPEMRRRHALLMTDLAEAAEPHLTSAARDPWMVRLDADLDNIRAALSWSLSEGGDAQLGLRLAGALGWYWYFRGYFVEGRKWLEKVIAQDVEAQSPHVRAKALHAASVIAGAQADRLTAQRWAAEAVDIWRNEGDSTELPFALTMLGLATVGAGDVAGGCLLVEKGVEQLRRVGDNWRLAVGLDRLADAISWHPDFEGAARAYHESMVLFQELGDLWGEAIERRELGGVALYFGHIDEAIQHYESALQLGTRVGNKQARAIALMGLGMAALRKEDFDKAEAQLEAALSYYKELGTPRYVMMTLRLLGYAAILKDDHQRAAEGFIEYLSIARVHGTEADTVLGLYAVARLSAAKHQAELTMTLLSFADATRRAAKVVVPTLDAAQLNTVVKLTRNQVPKGTWEQFSRSSKSVSKEEAFNTALAVCTRTIQTSDGASSVPATKVRRPQEPNPHGLSKREIELLGLVAVGLSNAEIAAQLFLSPNTVRAHLYSIYSKIDVTSRTAAAHYARKRNLA
jgi:predicted ATPase/DNA-binding NarL/FixJ family response regulator